MSHRILIAEDDADVRNLYCHLLRTSGYEVVEASDGEYALAKFMETPCDLIITDMNMPRMNGLELIKALRRLSPDVYIILITAYGTLDTEKRAFSLGSNEYMPKPFELIDLVERVHDYFNNKSQT